MRRYLTALAMATPLLVISFLAGSALAQKTGGILRMYDPDSPASMSIHEEGTIISERPMMGVFNNLVMFDQHVNKTASHRSCPIWPPAGRGMRKEPS